MEHILISQTDAQKTDSSTDTWASYSSEQEVSGLKWEVGSLAEVGTELEAVLGRLHLHK